LQTLKHWVCHVCARIVFLVMPGYFVIALADMSYIYKISGQESLGNYFFIDFMHWVLFCQNKIAAWFLSLWLPNGDIIKNFLFLRPSIWQLSPIWYSRYLIKQKCTYFLHLPKNIHILFRNHPVMHSMHCNMMPFTNALIIIKFV